MDRAQKIGLFRYQLARDAADASLSPRERGVLVRSLAAREHLGPDGRWVRVSRTTVDRWVRAYREGGFTALVPRPRRMPNKTPERLLELACALRREQPARTTAQIHRIIVETEGSSPSARTIQRHFVAAGLPWKGGQIGRALGRFEAEQRNELWTGDALHGPLIDSRRVFLFCFIDDHSRLLTGYRWAAREDVLNASRALRAGMAARGRPRAIYVDFVARHKINILFPDRLCARRADGARGRGGWWHRRRDVGHITFRARRASSAAFDRCARSAWCGVPPKCLTARWLGAPRVWCWC